MNGELMKKWMRENKLRAEDVASKLGISYPTVRTMMTGKNPHPNTIKAMAKLMDVSEDDLIDATSDGSGPEAA